MADPCNGGLSRRKYGSPSNLYVGVEKIHAIFDQLVPYASAIIARIPGYTSDLEIFCEGDPPDMPVWDLTDLTFFTGVLAPASGGTMLKIAHLLDNAIWRENCECVDGTPVLPPAPPQLPDKAGFATGVDRSSCYESGWAGLIPDTTGHNYDDPNYMIDLGPQLAPLTSSTPNKWQDSGHTFNAYPVLQQIWSVDWTIRTPTDTTNTDWFAPIFYIGYWNSVGNMQFRQTWQQNNTSAPIHGTWAPNFRPVAISIYAGAGHSQGLPPLTYDMTAAINLTWHCTGGNSPASDCCPPDAGVMTALSQIWQVVEDIQAKLSAQPGPFVDGARHATLSDTGSLVLGPKTVAVRVETYPPIPTSITVPGTPIYYYDMGFVTPYILGSPLRGTRITFNPHTVTLPTYTDQLGYTLRGGVLVDIVELELGP